MPKPEQDRVQTLLTDTVTLLCKNSLQCTKELKVQGLLGITLDDTDIFVVHINELYGPGGVVLTPQASSSSSSIARDKDKDKEKEKDKDTASSVDLTSRRSSTNSSHSKDSSPAPTTPSSGRRKRPQNSGVVIDLDKEDDVTVVASKRPRMGASPGGAGPQAGGRGFSPQSRMPPRGARGAMGSPGMRPGMSPKPFKCQFPGCDRAFNQRENLVRHQQHNHGVSPGGYPAGSPRGPQPRQPISPMGGRGARRSLPMNMGRGGRGGRGGMNQPVWVQQQGQWRMRAPQPGAATGMTAGAQPQTVAPTTPTTQPQIVSLVPNQASPGSSTQVSMASSQQNLPTASQALQQLRNEARASVSTSSAETTSVSNSSVDTSAAASNPPVNTVSRQMSAGSTAAGVTPRTSIDRESASDSESTGRQSASSHQSHSPGYSGATQSSDQHRILNIEPLSLQDDNISFDTMLQGSNNTSSQSYSQANPQQQQNTSTTSEQPQQQQQYNQQQQQQQYQPYDNQYNQYNNQQQSGYEYNYNQDYGQPGGGYSSYMGSGYSTYTTETDMGYTSQQQQQQTTMSQDEDQSTTSTTNFNQQQQQQQQQQQPIQQSQADTVQSSINPVPTPSTTTNTTTASQLNNPPLQLDIPAPGAELSSSDTPSVTSSPARPGPKIGPGGLLQSMDSTGANSDSFTQTKVPKLEEKGLPSLSSRGPAGGTMEQALWSGRQTSDEGDPSE